MSTSATFKFENIHNIHNEYFHCIEIFNDSWNFKRTFNNMPLIVAMHRDHLEIFKSLLAHNDIIVNCKDI